MTVISCGVNSFGHPGNRTLDTYRAIAADIYLMNNPCDTTDATGAPIDYSRHVQPLRDDPPGHDRQQRGGLHGDLRRGDPQLRDRCGHRQQR